jgi:hypothetical protein
MGYALRLRVLACCCFCWFCFKVDYVYFDLLNVSLDVTLIRRFFLLLLFDWLFLLFSIVFLLTGPCVMLFLL